MLPINTSKTEYVVGGPGHDLELGLETIKNTIDDDW